MNRLRILVPGLAVLILACGLLHGDDPKAPPASVKKGQLPAKWSKLGLTDEQKQKVRTVRGDYAARIEALRAQIANLQKEEKAALYKLLTDAKEEAHLGSPQKCSKMLEKAENSALFAWRQSGRNPVESRRINSTLLHREHFPLLPSLPSGF